MGIVFAALPLGKFRSLSVVLDQFQDGGVRQVALSEEIESRGDVAWYRHALHTLATWGSTSFNALSESHAVLLNIDCC